MPLRTRFPTRALALFVGALLSARALAGSAYADVKLPAIFSSHMVLQRDLANPVWGWADPAEEVTVSIGDQQVSTTTGQDGKWRVKLSALPAGGPYTLKVRGENEVVIDDVLVGEVWVCSGQSNMEWSLGKAVDGDLAVLAANLPKIRLISVPKVGTQEPQSDFKGAWAVCSPETVPNFSAVGFFFGRQLFETLDVPIGLINDAWGGSACEAWIPRDRLAADNRYEGMLANWEKIEKTYDFAKETAKYKEQFAKWKVTADEARRAGKPAPQAPRGPNNVLTGNARPANIFNGVLLPTIGYGIRGAIWYQGESNAGRAYQYRDLFPLMISTWRDLWGQGDFPFYWVQLADFKAEQAEPGDSDWAELREAQTMAMQKLPNTGQAVIIDLGEGRDIHPRNKEEVGKRLARWALARDYGIKVAYQSPLYKSMTVEGNKIVVTFDHVDRNLRTFDTVEPVGFAIAGADKKFVWAKAKISGPNKIEVWSDSVSEPQAVRYAWADNPVCNVTDMNDLPLTPFRTDDWPGITAGK